MVVSAGIAWALTPFTIRLGRAAGLMDQPDVRKVHAEPTPRFGGIAFVCAWLVVCPIALVVGVWLQWIEWNEALLPWLVLCAASCLVYVVGLIDDAVTLPSKVKLMAVVIAALVIQAVGFQIDVLPIPFVEDGLVLGRWTWLATTLFITALAVSVNFIDGLDGLAAGVTAIGLLTFAGVCAIGGLAVPALLSFALAGGLLGFLVYNHYPAKTFMGDGGSNFLGFTFAALGVSAAKAGDPVAGVSVPLIAMAVPVADATFIFFRRRVLQRRSLFASGWGHIHHHLLERRMDHDKVVYLLWLVTAGCAGLAALYWRSGDVGQVWALLGLATMLGVLFRKSRSLHLRECFQAILRNRKIARDAGRYRKTYEAAQLRFLRARTFDHWWEELCRAASELDFVRLRMEADRRDGSTNQLAWHNTNGHAHCEVGLSTFVPVPQRRSDTPLQAEVFIGSDDSLESAGLRLSLFVRLVDEYSLRTLVDADATGELAPPAVGRHGRAEAGPIGPLSTARVAIVHDFLYCYGGAERVLEQMLAVYPQAEVYSLFDFVPDDERAFLKNKRVHTSFIQRIPLASKHHRHFLPIMPLAIEQLDVSHYDVVISSSYLAAKGVITRPDQLHVCYCHTPVRFAWDLQHQYLDEQNLGVGLKSFLVRAILQYVRNFDVRSSNGVDVFMSNSDFIGRRIQKAYRRTAKTVYPPVDLETFHLPEPEVETGDYYLVASRLVPYKRVQRIVQAFNRMPDRKLIVVGTGPLEERLREAANDNVQVLGYQPTDKLVELMQRAKAFVFAAEEDFGIVAVEAQACGAPVIAYGRGGATETVIDGVTGVLFEDPGHVHIMDAVERFESLTFDRAAIRQNAERFSTGRFRAGFASLVDAHWELFRRRREGGPAPATAPELATAGDRQAIDDPRPAPDLEVSTQEAPDLDSLAAALAPDRHALGNGSGLVGSASDPEPSPDEPAPPAPA
ncbi:MAG: glycosyltransferase [Planctomycetota bacterium]